MQLGSVSSLWKDVALYRKGSGKQHPIAEMPGLGSKLGSLYPWQWGWRRALLCSASFCLLPFNSA